MDFLRVLNRYNQPSLREDVASSVLNYFLAPGEDHGFGGELLASFLAAVEGEDADLWRELRSPQANARVSAEEPMGGDGGRIDSLVLASTRRKTLLVGMEVKIRDRSVQPGQLTRYAESLLSWPLDDEEDVEILGAVERRLVFLVPDGGESWRKEVREFEELRKQRPDWPKLVLLHWHRNEAASSAPSVSELLQGLLKRASLGEIPRPNPTALELAGSLTHGARNSFFEETVVPGTFVTQATFAEALDEQGQLGVFRMLCKVVKAEVPRANLFARTHHTSIGVPRAPNPTGGGNSLYRIRTVDSYSYPTVLHHVQLEFPVSHFGRDVLEAACRKALRQDSGSTGALTLSVLPQEHFHEDRRRRDKVWLMDVRCDDAEPDLEEIESILRCLHRSLLEHVAGGGPGK